MVGEETTIGALLDETGGSIKTGPFGTKLKASEYTATGVPVISVGEVGFGRLRIHEDTPRVDESVWSRMPEFILQAGDIVFGRKGAVERSAQIQPEEDGFFLGSDGIRIRLDGRACDPKFIAYQLQTAAHKSWMIQHAGGTTMPSLNEGIIRRIPIRIKPLAEQKAIATVLGALDDKIELNRRMNATLEAMARALFQSWFVDFDRVRAKLDGRQPTGLDPATAALFPNEFEDSEVGAIPKGWRVGTIGGIADVIDCLHSKKPDRRQSGQLFLQLNNIRDDGLLDLADSFLISDEDYANWISRMEAQAGDCIITNVGRVGAVSQIPEGVRAALGRNMTGIRCKPDFPFPTFLLQCLLSDAMRDEIGLKIDSGTILDALNVKSIPLLRFAQPPTALATSFEQAVRPMRNAMETNLRQSRTLAAIRDALLPKLLNGTVSI